MIFTKRKKPPVQQAEGDYLVTSAPSKRSVPPVSHKKATIAKHIIAIASGKGGVGKSSLTYHLAMALQARQHRVGVIDADIYGPSLSAMFAVSDQKAISDASQDNSSSAPIQPLLVANGIEFMSVSALMDDDAAVIWRAPMATKLIHQFLHAVAWSALDYLLIDLPPGTGDIQISLVQQAKLSAALVVTTPQKLAYRVAEKAIQMFERVQVPVLGFVENMSYYVCQHCQQQHALFQGDAIDYLKQKYQLDCLGQVPLDPMIALAGDEGQSIFMTAASSAAAQAFESIADQLEQGVERLKQYADQPQDIAVDDKGWLKLAWSDQGESVLSPYQLRVACRCAACVDEMSGEPLLQVETVNNSIRMLRIDPVGHYGIKIQFSDGHQTGIYTFEALKQLTAAGGASVR